MEYIPRPRTDAFSLTPSAASTATAAKRPVLAAMTRLTSPRHPSPVRAPALPRYLADKVADKNAPIDAQAVPYVVINDDSASPPSNAPPALAQCLCAEYFSPSKMGIQGLATVGVVCGGKLTWAVCVPLICLAIGISLMSTSASPTRTPLALWARARSSWRRPVRPSARPSEIVTDVRRRLWQLHDRQQRPRPGGASPLFARLTCADADVQDVLCALALARRPRCHAHLARRLCLYRCRRRRSPRRA